MACSSSKAISVYDNEIIDSVALVVNDPFLVSLIVEHLLPEDVRAARLVSKCWCDATSTSNVSAYTTHNRTLTFRSKSNTESLH